MTTRTTLAHACLAGIVAGALAACGSSPAGSGSVPRNIFTGNLVISSALPAGTTTCLTTQIVNFTSAGADTHQITVAGGGCVQFVNGDTVPHQPASIPIAGCPELNAPLPVAATSSFLTAPLSGPKTCDWQDLLNPPGGGGGGGGGGGY